MTTAKLTKARREALEVLGAGAARYSNETALFPAPVGELAGVVYWQSADWLLEAGFAERGELMPHGQAVTITDAGRELLEAVR